MDAFFKIGYFYLTDFTNGRKIILKCTKSTIKQPLKTKKQNQNYLRKNIIYAKFLENRLKFISNWYKWLFYWLICHLLILF
ncbi:Hypothetical protein MAG3030 [Mycoplasmopsis agalactiae PG2]|uniref:Uncharacterized protein n=1 Tax=Mycoplasmopsis agalactiae (strain NCTC 10123 / CIP 59.7 / PG2) TaxID=347257 RepID=A5IY92_MYCAP|nr:Hypothetical protein MAG3030 [Mycoplasmopsis agalactiae PG2]